MRGVEEGTEEHCKVENRGVRKTVQYIAVQYSTVQYSTVQYIAVQ